MITPPEYLSPSSVGTYRSCPQKFKISRIDRVPEPPTWHTHLGTFVHEVLEHMYGCDPAERTRDNARVFARTVWDASGWQQQVEQLSQPLGTVNEFKRAALGCIENLFSLENPEHTEFDGVEHNVTAVIEGVEMRGIIDRFMFTDDGIVISDYKTGKVPSPRFTSEDDKFFQLLAYALMLKESDDEDTAKVQLLYLAKPVVHELEVTPVKLSIAKGTIVETKEALDTSCAAAEFHCNVTKLCDWCYYKTSGHCPAFAGRG